MDPPEESDTQSAPEADELLYRRFSPDSWHSSKHELPIPVSSFRPFPWKSEDRPGDKDGLSVSCASLVSPEVVCVSERTGRVLSLVQFPKSAIDELGLSLVAKPTETNPGHMVIPELNSLDYRDEAGALRIDEFAAALRERATVIIEGEPISQG